MLFLSAEQFRHSELYLLSPDAFARLWMPYYKKVNNWIHANTGWKTFKHSCGAVESLMELFIESGFDIINPVQINASGMDPELLKKKYGDRLIFWEEELTHRVCLLSAILPR